ncbi:MAG: ABC transporter substrate-binding protein, partial [Alsobacter sp.]
MKADRRTLLAGSAALAAAGLLPRPAPAQSGFGPQRHGFSAFGDLAYGPEATHFAYVNPDAPKGGSVALQISRTQGNQAFDTFNTLNIYVLKGDGAAGMNLTFASLMDRAYDEPDAVYGLAAESVALSQDGLVQRYQMRPQARFHDGTPLTAADAAFSIMTLKAKGHPLFAQILRMVEAATALDPATLEVRYAPGRSRDLPLVVAVLPIFSQAYYRQKPFEEASLEAPLGSGPYRVARLEQGRFIEFERVADWWGTNLPAMRGSWNFDRLRYEYFRDR